MKDTLIAFVSILLLVNSTYAHMEIESVDSIMGLMMTNQGVSEANQINCNSISNHEFEELGDSVMDRMIGNRELHEQMDNMMGGEGSESLKQMHIIIGKNWLGCDGFQGMMGGMMPMMMRMMGNYYPAYYTGYNATLIFAVFGWALVIVLVIILVLILTDNIKIRKRK